MASNSNSKLQTTKFGKFSKLSLMLLLLVAILRQCAHAIDMPRSICSTVADNSISKRCPYNGFIHNPNSRNCTDRYVCYLGPGEICDENIVERRCNPQLVCNKCHRCQNCVDRNCNLELCQDDLTNSILKRWLIKRFERNFLDSVSGA